MKKAEYTIRSLEETDIPIILELQDIVFSALQNAEFLRRNTYETLSFCFKHPHFILGIFKDDQLAAVCIFVDASGTEEDLSLDLRNYSCTKPINAKLTLVHPQFRGHGWQRFMFQICANLAREQGYRQIIATVSPDNIYSRNNMIRLGMTEDHREIKYGGLLRAVMFLELEQEKNIFRTENNCIYEENCDSTDTSLCYNGVKVCTEDDIGVIINSEAVFPSKTISLRELKNQYFILKFPASFDIR